ncbi:MAG: hypothetical protein JRG91_19100, partial [Deltaproteobacteria bacterium]|nr:hypothetical protein [Deltaproteobacteria bacterium]
MRLALILCALLACGCQSSFGLEGDAVSEPGVDVVFDWVADPVVDPAADPAVDPSV